MYLCNFPAWATHFDHPNVRVSNQVMAPWVRVGRSHLPGGGYGLFALHIFKKVTLSQFIGVKSVK